MRNGLKGLLASEDIEACGIDPTLRPEALEPEQFGLLAQRHHEMRRHPPAGAALLREF